jgi:hypothetical protein
MRKYVIILIGFFLWNCSEDMVPFYSGEHAIYFVQGNTPGEVNFAFGSLGVMDSVIRVAVTSTGPIVDYERRFRVEYDSVSGEEGIHFDSLPAEGIFPAGAANGYVPIRLRRVQDDQEIYTIRIRLVENEEFTLNLPEKYENRDTIDLVRMNLNYSSAFTKPLGWQELVYGYFSVAKYVVACEVTGRDATFWNANASQTSMALAPAIASYVNGRILAGRDQALRDPNNPYPQDKGFMTMRGAYATYAPTVDIPDDWEPAD